MNNFASRVYFFGENFCGKSFLRITEKTAKIATVNIATRKHLVPQGNLSKFAPASFNFLISNSR